uniref:Ubiquitin associated protein 2 n=1 Tax=Chelonoidis abingdonii TaxID=106734 RepID=A0A8C0JCG9_CHEAB
MVNATAEQIRLAQMIYDKNDADFEDKVKQLMEVTGKNQDECIVALHDCNGDVNRAINILLEGSSDTTSWETVGGKKKSLGKESSENKENREKRGDREVSRGRGSSNRRGRGGGSRGREFQMKRGGISFCVALVFTFCVFLFFPTFLNPRTFNPADYTETSATDGFGPKPEVWETGQNDADDGTGKMASKSGRDLCLISLLSHTATGAWKNSIEEWTTEDWNEDLSETKVFTASSVPAENHITPGQSIDLVTLLQKPVTSSQETEGISFESPQQQSFGQALVFTNSQHNTQMATGPGNSSAVNSYSPQSLSSVLCSGFGELGSSKLANSTGSPLLDQLKSPGLGQFTSPSSQQNSSSSTATTATTTSSWDLKPSISQSSVLSQFDFKSQPEPSPVLSQLTQRQQQQTQAVPVPPPGLESSSSQVKLGEPSPVDSSMAASKMLQLPSMSMDNQAVSAHQTQQKQIKPPKRRIPPASKIPASAVEMPGSADVTGLNVQFGALEFGSEPSLPEFGSAPSNENISQVPSNSLYSKPVNDPLNTSLPISNTVQESTYTTSAITSSSLTCSSQSTSPVTTSSSYDQTSVHSRIAYQSSMAPSDSIPVAVTWCFYSGVLQCGLSTLVESTASLQPSTTFSTASTSATSTTSSVVSMASSMNTTNSLGLSVTSVSMPAASTRAAPLVSSGKAPPNLPQGVPPLLHNQYIVGPGGLLPAYPIYGYDDLQMLQSRLPMDYYGITFPAPATLTGRDGSLANNPYSGDVTKFGRGDSASPAPATTLAQPQQNQTQTHHTTQQPFLNPTLPPGYSYTGLPYYAGMPGVPSAFQYGPTMFVPPASAKQHVDSYDDLTQGTAAGDYSKGGYSGSSQAQNKSAGTGPGKGVSVTSSNTGVPDISGSVYNKTQTFDKQGFHASTPPPFSLPSALGSTGPLNPGAAPGYAPAPFLHILPAHQQPHSQMLHHHLQQDGQGGSGQRNQPSTMQQKSQATKTAYGTSPYWTN